MSEKTEGEAFTVVSNVADMNGLEAWRKLCLRFDARTYGKKMLLMRQYVSPPKIKDLRVVAAEIERWEERTRQLSQYDIDLVKAKPAILLEMVPTAFQDALISRITNAKTADDKDDFPTIKATVLEYLTQRVDLGGAPTNGPRPPQTRWRRTTRRQS